jgi:hypothetical protein
LKGGDKIEGSTALEAIGGASLKRELFVFFLFLSRGDIGVAQEKGWEERKNASLLY